MTYIVEIIIIILVCVGCFMMYAECECCHCESAIDTNSELQNSSTVSPIQDDSSNHIEI